MRPRAIFFVALFFVLAAFLHVAGPGPTALGYAPSEITGTVIEPNGGPIVAARVELRAGGTVVSTATTDLRGGFVVRVREGVPGDLSLRVERMGYRAEIRAVGAGEGSIVIVLRPEPLPLPGLRVEVEAPTCEWADAADARALWEAMARRHPDGLDTLGIASYTMARTDTLPANSAQATGDGTLVPGQRSSAPLLRMSWERRVARQGYAFRVRRTDRAGSFDSWSYAPLEADFAAHFASPTFGRLHRFRVTGRSREDGWLVRFCPGDPGRPTIEGQLEIGPDTLLYRAEWRFRTGEPDEDAGGWARFVPPPAGNGEPYLLPLESLVWRDVPRDQGTWRRAQWYEAWVLAPGDSVPFLPSREGAQRGEEGGEGGAPRR